MDISKINGLLEITNRNKKSCKNPDSRINEKGSNASFNPVPQRTILEKGTNGEL